MKIINAEYKILTPINRGEILKNLEIAGRTCYKSEDKITETSAADFVKMLIKRGHEAMIEHEKITVKITCDRGVSHEIVRHRIASYGQESTRYVNYSKGKFGSEIIVIDLATGFKYDLANEIDYKKYKIWTRAMQFAEKSYLEMIELGASPQEARSVLPNSLKTEIVVTMNLREWRHFFNLRTAKDAHPQMQEITRPLLFELKEKLPELFEDIEVNNES